MRAAVPPAHEAPLRVADVQLDASGPADVLLRTTATGICHSGLHEIEGAVARSVIVFD